ncbi:MAG: hypothetical protein AB7L90_04805 [Hyphomicrobiaceae bacterium]
MAEHHVKLEITPRVVDLGERVIQLHHVVSAGRRSVYPLRPVGLAVMLAGLALIGNEAVTRGSAAFALHAGGSLPLWVGFAALGVSLFLLLYVRRVLAIQTSDGRQVELAAASEEAATDLILRIRHAMESAGATGAIHGAGGAPIALQAGGPASLTHRAMPVSGQSQLETAGSGVPLHTAPPTGEPPHVRTIPAGRPAGLHSNGHAGNRALGSGMGTSEGGSITDQAVQAYRRAGGGTAPVQQREQGGLSERRLLGPETGAQGPSRESLGLPDIVPTGFLRNDGAQDLHALVEHVRRSDVQHKEALLDLLGVVEDHYRGRASREDAIAHWRSFADYVVQYLGDVDGLIAQTERFGRHMLPR